MAQGFIDSYVHATLDYMFSGAGTDVSPTTWYLGLLTTAPASNGVGAVEVSAIEYARQPMDPADWEVAGTTTTRYITNTTTVNWPEVTQSGGWGAIVNVGLYSTLSGSTLKGIAALTGGVVFFGEGATREIQPGELRIYLPWIP